MMEFDNFIFDLDGTLIDSTPSHVKAFKQAISTSTVAEKSDSFNYEEMKGKRTIDVMTELGFSADEAKVLTKAKQEAYRELLNNGKVDLFEGVKECFQYLVESNKRVFICTGASRPSVEIILKKFGLDEYITDYVTGSDVSEAKPSPKILLELLERNKLDNTECVFVEDSMNGKLCGEGAFVQTIIVNNPEIQGNDDFTAFVDFYNSLRDER